MSWIVAFVIDIVNQYPKTTQAVSLIVKVVLMVNHKNKRSSTYNVLC